MKFVPIPGETSGMLFNKNAVATVERPIQSGPSGQCFSVRIVFIGQQWGTLAFFQTLQDATKFYESFLEDGEEGRRNGM